MTTTDAGAWVYHKLTDNAAFSRVYLLWLLLIESETVKCESQQKGEYSGSNTRSACWKTNLRSDGNGIRRYYAHTFCAMVKLSER